MAAVEKAGTIHAAIPGCNGGDDGPGSCTIGGTSNRAGHGERARPGQRMVGEVRA
jgi:hypothetical protein